MTAEREKDRERLEWQDKRRARNKKKMDQKMKSALDITNKKHTH